MAVYRRSYKIFNGPYTPAWSRFLVLPRFIYQDVFASKMVTGYFVLCFVPCLISSVLIYLKSNARALEMLSLPVSEIIPIDGTFFLTMMWIQGSLAFFLTVFTGPGLVSMDLSNNALPLYLCRPFNRTDYVLGKMSVTTILLSLITWVPLMFLWILHSSLEGWSWAWQNLYLLSGILLGSLIWILILSLLNLAISAWVRWKPIAGAMLFGIFFIGAGFGEAVNEIMQTSRGTLLNLQQLIETIWSWLFRVPDYTQISVGNAWTMLILVCLFCLFMLTRKIKAYEVVN